MKNKQITLEKISAMINGYIARGDKKYAIVGLTSVNAVKAHELCIVANCTDIHNLSREAQAVVSTKEMEAFLRNRKLRNIIIVDDIQKASCTFLQKLNIR